MGAIETARLTLITVLKQRFGHVPPELETPIRTTTNLDTLMTAFRLAFTIDSLEKFVL